MANHISDHKAPSTCFRNERDAEALRYAKADGRFRFILAVATAISLLLSRVAIQGYPEGIHKCGWIIVIIIAVVYLASGLIQLVFHLWAIKQYRTLSEVEDDAGSKLLIQYTFRYRLFSIVFALLLFVVHLPIWHYLDPQVFPLESRYSTSSESTSLYEAMEEGVDLAYESTQGSSANDDNRDGYNSGYGRYDTGLMAGVVVNDSSEVSENQLWSTALQRVGQYEVIAGPVISVQWSDSPTKPTYLNIGKDFPDPSRAQLIIWPEDTHSFEEMLNAVDDGGWWIYASGYIREYEGVPEIELKVYNTYNYWYEG